MKIDADKLKAEIEKRAKFHNDAMKACIGLNNVAITHSAGWKEDTEIITIIDSLQQEQQEVDLEKEIAIYFQGFWPGMKTPEARNHQLVLTTSAIMELIEYFFKLGLNTRKEE